MRTSRDNTANQPHCVTAHGSTLQQSPSPHTPSHTDVLQRWRCTGGRRLAAHSGPAPLPAPARPPHRPAALRPAPPGRTAACSVLIGGAPSSAARAEPQREDAEPGRAALPPSSTAGPGAPRRPSPAPPYLGSGNASPCGVALQPGRPVGTGALCSRWAAAGPGPHLAPALPQALLHWLHCAPITPLIQDGGAPRTGFPLPLSTGCRAAQRWAREAATEPIAGKVPPPAGVAGREGKGARRPRARTQVSPCAWRAPRGGRERGGRGGAGRPRLLRRRYRLLRWARSGAGSLSAPNS